MKKDLAVIFDLDGTLLNTDLLIHKTFDHVFEKYKPGYILSEEEHLSFLGPTLKDTFARYFPESMSDELIEYYRDYNHAHHEDFVTIYPTVKETLETLKNKGYPLAVVTTKYSKAAYLGLDLFDLTQYFDVVLGMDNVNRVKPDPEGILKAMNQTNCKKALYVGDNTSDILAGKNAGVHTAGVKWTPKGTSEMEKLNPDLMIDEMKDIIHFIERMD
ncbi:MAG: pyrophosphatase PpaX [Longibaculum muris]|uniref:Pyrophosphatase PpaX n=1 Tax=Longibaculum muris TaxID=1796628 RepID=A0A4R3YV97_9FIRM|nr:pyrophosphatase PpaX [Longibaculum muris]KXU52033.1 HAD hydrolase, family IA, variant 1 [Candidatus Stoquefichus sp. KLE1796]MBS5370326.1 pyrophosphatase PpaX [Coprobacillus cateniformis]MCR1888805.1 pyrophosphatase PpaX [Longibaculum muris]MED9813457.1 pyrophosphatase PpaX [Longibaculum muris]TCV95314.1 pyrophosphatase PpaX [Longibaculum muris]